MISLRRILGFMLLFLFFEGAAALTAPLWWHGANVFVACLAMTALAVGVWAAFYLLARMLARAAQPRSAQKAAARPKSAIEEDSFTAEMRSLVREANRRLEAVTLPKGQREAPSLATLPLYLIVGPEGSGKTSVMLHSGLEPRLLAGEALRDGTTVPTRLANLWFAENAVFAELSGRLLMQDPAQWEKALRILADRRPLPLWRRILFGPPARPNLRGVVLVCDTNLFLHANDLQRLGSVGRTLNERLQAVQSVFRRAFPVYILLSRCDSVEHFAEFFAHLSEAESRRTLGVTLPLLRSANEAADLHAEHENRRLTTFFNRLYQSIADKRMVLLAREESRARKALAYEFPRELKKLRGDLVQFLLDVFRPATLHAGCSLRGFYFCGKRLVARGNSAPEGSVADFSVAKPPAEATVFFGSTHRGVVTEQSVVIRRASREVTVPKWTFLSELFREIILADPAAALPTPERSGEPNYRTVALAGAGLLSLVISLLWIVSWQNNHRLLSTVEASVESARMLPQPGSVEGLSDLEAMRPVLAKLHGYERKGAPLSYTFGLYSGDKAAAELDAFYFDRFRRAILEPVLSQMTTHLLALAPSTPVAEDVYKELKSYRTLTSRSCNPDESTLSPTLFALWSGAVAPQPESAALADRQIHFYTAELQLGDPYHHTLAENGEAVSRAQSYLRDLSGPEKILHALTSQVSRDVAAERLGDYAADYTQVLSGPNELDGAYTRAGWAAVEGSIRDHKLASAGEPCVVGAGSGASAWDAASDTEVQKLYSQSYAAQWKAYLAAHHVLPFAGVEDASQKLRTLADNNRSPLLALVYMTSTNTNVAAPQTVSDRVSSTLRSAAEDTEKSLQHVIHRLDGSRPDPGPQASPAATPAVLAAFAPVHVMVDPASRDTWLNEKNQGYMKALEELSTALAALPPRIDKGSPNDLEALEHSQGAVASANLALHSLEGLFPNTPQGIDVDLDRLLREPIDYAARSIREVPLMKPVTVASMQPPPAPVVPAGPSARELAEPVIEQVNSSEKELCTQLDAVAAKYPFDATATVDISLDELNQVLAPATSALARFSTSPDVSKAYTHQGRAWAAKPDFPATFSQPFLFTLNNLGLLADELYGEGGVTPHFEYTITLDGTGKIPFELDVDGHTIEYKPGKTSVPVHLVWPPLTNAPTRLVVKTGFKGGIVLPAQNAGPWSLFHLLQAADDQSGQVFTFRTVEFAHSLVPLMNEKGTAGTIQIRVDSPAGNLFSRGYFARARCDGSWALH